MYYNNKPNYQQLTMNQLLWNVANNSTIAVKTKEQDEILSLAETMVERFMNAVNKNNEYRYGELLKRVETIASQDYYNGKEGDMINSLARGLAYVTEEVANVQETT